MSVYQDSCDWAARRDMRRGARRSGAGALRPSAWRPFELAAMIVGFALFWPVGLAILFAKIGQQRESHPGDLFAYSRDKLMGSIPASFQAARTGWSARNGFAGFGGFTSGSGNLAFDEWRSRELDRLEEERRKLADAEREFADHLERLKMARDREEFERFMAERNARPASGTTQV